MTTGDGALELVAVPRSRDSQQEVRLLCRAYAARGLSAGRTPGRQLYAGVVAFVSSIRGFSLRWHKADLTSLEKERHR